MKIVSGGQTGVDRAALDAARQAGIEAGGWCPAGRWAEDGTIPERYRLNETPDSMPAQRTEWNVRDSDATLILTHTSELHGGSELTRRAADHHGRPCLVVDLRKVDTTHVVGWLRSIEALVLNVAGPRESESPGIYAAAATFLQKILDECRA